MDAVENLVPIPIIVSNTVGNGLSLFQINFIYI